MFSEHSPGPFRGARQFLVPEAHSRRNADLLIRRTFETPKYHERRNRIRGKPTRNCAQPQILKQIAFQAVENFAPFGPSFWHHQLRNASVIRVPKSISILITWLSILKAISSGLKKTWYNLCSNLLTIVYWLSFWFHDDEIE